MRFGRGRCLRAGFKISFHELMGFDAAQLCGRIPTLRWTTLPPSSPQPWTRSSCFYLQGKDESSMVLRSVGIINTLRHNPDDHDLKLHRRENLKSRSVVGFGAPVLISYS